MSSTTVDGHSSNGAITLFWRVSRTGTIVSGAHRDGGRRNVGILLNGQGGTDDAQNDNRMEMTAESKRVL